MERSPRPSEHLTAEKQNLFDKKAAIANIVTRDFEGLAPDAIFPLSGGIVQRKDGRWETAGANDSDAHGSITIARARMIAGAEIAHTLPSATVVTNSFNRFNPSEPTMASVAQTELMRHNVPAENIFLEEQSFSTITQYVEMIRMAVTHNWSHLTIVANSHYVPRAIALYDHLNTIVEDDEFQQDLRQFHASQGIVSFVEAEQILGIIDDRYTRYFDHLRQTEVYQTTVQREASGLRDLQAGTYRVRLQAELPRN